MKRIALAVAMAISIVALTASVVVAASPSPSPTPNHGDVVSAVAKAWDHLNGEAHGDAVSAIASAHGKLISAAAKAKHLASASPAASNHDSIGDLASEPGQLKAGAGRAH